MTVATRRHYSEADHLLLEIDRGLRTLFGKPQTTERPHPATGLPAPALSPDEARTAVRLMRVNHCGEVCAQALYQGQALAARDNRVRDKLRHAADEENDHLDWCRVRIEELGGRTSRLDPLFYLSSLTLGAVAGAAGDRWSLGFLSATERQVEAHLESHLKRLPEADTVSRAIVEQMRKDEAQHAETADAAGASELPAPIRRLMRLTAKLMTGTTYWV